MKILALTKYGPLGASSRVRTLQYVPYLRAQGFEVTVGPLLDDYHLARRYAGEASGIEFILRSYLSRTIEALRSREYDLVWIEKELMPWMPSLVERGILAGTPYVLDYDDAIFHTYDQHPLPILRRLMGRKIDRLMRGAALVVAGNAYLCERARAAGAPRVEEVPSVIDLERYGPVLPPPDGPFTIGWIGSPGSERLLDYVGEVLAEITHQPNVRLVLVGATERALKGVPHETWQWEEATEVQLMRKFHVGIMPLPMTPWVRGKCGYKLIQCMGAGRAVIASRVGANIEIVDHGVSGFLVESPDEWYQAIIALQADSERCARQGRIGRKIVERRYDIRITAPRVADLLRQVVRALPGVGAPRMKEFKG